MFCSIRKCQKGVFGRSPTFVAPRFWSTCPLVQTEDGFAGYSVSYKGETTQFSATEVTAMFLTKLKQVTEAWCGAKVADAVIAVPSYFADFQRAGLVILGCSS
ncbi:SSE1 [Symbiodinium sp. CCMP2592]|nr:SSE1 [Symbiodinium sp. CCMP2592]